MASDQVSATIKTYLPAVRGFRTFSYSNANQRVWWRIPLCHGKHNSNNNNIWEQHLGLATTVDDDAEFVCRYEDACLTGLTGFDWGLTTMREFGCFDERGLTNGTASYDSTYDTGAIRELRKHASTQSRKQVDFVIIRLTSHTLLPAAAHRAFPLAKPATRHIV